MAQSNDLRARQTEKGLRTPILIGLLIFFALLAVFASVYGYTQMMH